MTEYLSTTSAIDDGMYSGMKKKDNQKYKTTERYVNRSGIVINGLYYRSFTYVNWCMVYDNQIMPNLHLANKRQTYTYTFNLRTYIYFTYQQLHNNHTSFLLVWQWFAKCKPFVSTISKRQGNEKHAFMQNYNKKPEFKTEKTKWKFYQILLRLPNYISSVRKYFYFIHWYIDCINFSIFINQVTV